MQPNGGILCHYLDGFNFGNDTLFWGNGYVKPSDIKLIYCSNEQKYFEYDCAADILGSDTKYWPQVVFAEFEDFEVFL